MSSNGKLAIAAIGIPPRELSILKCIFNLSASRAHSYELATANQPPDILIVDGDNPRAISEWRTLYGGEQHQPTLPTVIVSTADTPPPAPLYALKRPIVASRVHGILDQIALQYKTSEPVALQYKALVVDDSPTIRKQIELELAQLGIAADLAETGEEAIGLLNQNQKYDLIFLDVVLPGVDGYNLCKTIKRDKLRKRTPVIMLTGKGSPFDFVRGKLAGCNTYLTKPAGRERFQAVVKKYLA